MDSDLCATGQPITAVTPTLALPTADSSPRSRINSQCLQIRPFTEGLSNWLAIFDRPTCLRNRGPSVRRRSWPHTLSVQPCQLWLARFCLIKSIGQILVRMVRLLEGTTADTSVILLGLARGFKFQISLPRFRSPLSWPLGHDFLTQVNRENSNYSVMNFPKEVSTVFKLMNDGIRYYLHWLPRIRMHSSCPLPEQLRCSKTRLDWPVTFESQMTGI